MIYFGASGILSRSKISSIQGAQWEKCA